MSIQLLRALHRGEKQTLALIDKECDLKDPDVRRARALKVADIERLEQAIRNQSS